MTVAKCNLGKLLKIKFKIQSKQQQAYNKAKKTSLNVRYTFLCNSLSSLHDYDVPL